MTAPLDHVEHALGIASLVTIGVIAGSLHLAVKVIVDTVRPQWRRIVSIMLGQGDPARVEASFLTRVGAGR